jgi:hypothetical protein
VLVSVTDDGLGGIKTDIRYNDGTAVPTFTNTYVPNSPVIDEPVVTPTPTPTPEVTPEPTPGDGGGTDEPGGGDDTAEPGEPDEPGEQPNTPNEPAPNVPQEPRDNTAPPAPGGTDPEVPPAPVVPEHELRQVVDDDGEYFVEFGEDGNPLGEWHWVPDAANPDEGEWVFESYPPPLADVPSTDDTNRLPLTVALIAFVLSLGGLTLTLGRRRRRG